MLRIVGGLEVLQLFVTLGVAVAALVVAVIKKAPGMGAVWLMGGWAEKDQTT